MAAKRRRRAAKPSTKRRSAANVERHPNPMLLILIGNAIADKSAGGSFEGAVMNAVVHAWYEGHIEAEDETRPAAVGVSEAVADLPDGSFPTPPFPTVANARRLIDETTRIFDPQMRSAAVAYGAAIAWKAGRAEGVACKGCSYRGHAPAHARDLRDGRFRAEVRLFDMYEDPASFVFSAYLAPTRAHGSRTTKTSRRMK